MAHYAQYLELLLLACAATGIVFRPRTGRQLLAGISQVWQRLATQRGWSILAVGLLALGGRAAVLPLNPIPAPRVHDGFVYLLQAETLAAGRLTNPPHPLWEHFESMHLIQQPSYTGKYPVGQSLFLAVGILLADQPWVGVWLSCGLMSMALCWMLQGWVPGRWALLGSMLAVLKLCLFTYWSNNYWGGAVAALGGALLLGALPRIQREGRVKNALLLGLGLGILANSRPYEGMMLGLPVAFILLGWFIRQRTIPWRVTICRVGLPLLMVLGLTASAMGFYNWRVTGHPLQSPYQVWRETYQVGGLFIWQKPRREPTFRHPMIRKYQAAYDRREFHGLAQLLGEWWRRLSMMEQFFLGPALTIPLLGVVCFFRRQSSRHLLFLTLFALGTALSTMNFYPHYLAPATALIYLLIIEGLRHLRLLTVARRPLGRGLARGVLVVFLTVLLVNISWRTWAHFKPASAARPWYEIRAAIITTLTATPDKHLIIVRYRPSHNTQDEWVYNRPEIDRAKVIWARDMGRERNRTLLHYFKDRQIWLLEADTMPQWIVPYP